MNTAAHAILAPSSAPQWAHCSASVAAQAGLPDVETPENRVGTAAHWVVSETLIARKNGLPKTCDFFIGKQAPNGVVIDEEMAEGAQVMVDDVCKVCEQMGAYSELLIEERVYMPRIHKDNWGTLDAALYLPDRKVLFIWDYKHGHRYCEAEGNFQLINYIEGITERFGIDGYLDQQITVIAKIVQPFCYHSPGGPIQDWTIRLSDLRSYWNILQSKAHEALNDPKLSTGVWCRDCKALGRCSAARKAQYNFISLLNQPFQMDSMSTHDLAVEKNILQDNLAVAKARIEALEDELDHRIRNGFDNGGYTLEVTPGREVWAIPSAQAAALFQNFGTDISKSDVLTPRQSLQKTPANLRHLAAAIIKQFTTRKSTTKIVPIDRSRIARAFKSKTMEQ